ncbi:hypothetical protein E2C01_013301 [Portunus trituberculatus]|uniref:Uncharacterized protein n=1 Tax=Portunus trituberculatus TaxID=210409 RepID=A0A5B7DGQ1_PORTR|nr:hypothetical protein [Portunus trituberculatus]
MCTRAPRRGVENGFYNISPTRPPLTGSDAHSERWNNSFTLLASDRHRPKSQLITGAGAAGRVTRPWRCSGRDENTAITPI